MNKQLVEKVKKLILKHHEHFAMPTWTEGFYASDVINLDAMVHGCGTFGCLGAWTCIAAGLEIHEEEWIGEQPGRRMHVEAKATELLGAEYAGVFFFGRWPDPAFEKYCDAKENHDTLGMAQAACDALDEFGEMAEPDYFGEQDED